MALEDFENVRLINSLTMIQIVTIFRTAIFHTASLIKTCATVQSGWQLAQNADQYNTSSWFAPCATSRKVPGSTPYGVNGIFYLLNHSD